MRILIIFAALLFLANAELRHGSQIFLKFVGSTYQELLNAQQKILIVDPQDISLSNAQTAFLRGKGKIILAYLILGRAEATKKFWQPECACRTPEFILKEDPKFPGSYFVKYWLEEWQQLILNYTHNYIVPFGYSGVLLDYMKDYKNSVDERPDAAKEMINFALEIAHSVRQRNPETMVFTQDSIELYEYPEYKAMVDGVGMKNLYYKHTIRLDDSITYEAQPLAYSNRHIAILDGILADNKLVMVEEYIEKNNHICDFYKTCSISGYICGVFDLKIPGGTRSCVKETPKP